MKALVAIAALLVACTVATTEPTAPDAGGADADVNTSQICRNLQSGNTDGYLLHQGECSDEIDGTVCTDAVRVPAGSVGCCDELAHWHPCTMQPH